MLEGATLSPVIQSRVTRVPDGLSQMHAGGGPGDRIWAVSVAGSCPLFWTAILLSVYESLGWTFFTPPLSLKFFLTLVWSQCSELAIIIIIFFFCEFHQVSTAPFPRCQSKLRLFLFLSQVERLQSSALKHPLPSPFSPLVLAPPGRLSVGIRARWPGQLSNDTVSPARKASSDLVHGHHIYFQTSQAWWATDFV